MPAGCVHVSAIQYHLPFTHAEDSVGSRSKGWIADKKSSQSMNEAWLFHAGHGVYDGAGLGHSILVPIPVHMVHRYQHPSEVSQSLWHFQEFSRVAFAENALFSAKATLL